MADTSNCTFQGDQVLLGSNSRCGGDLRYNTLLDTRVDKSSRNLDVKNGLKRQISTSSSSSASSWALGRVQKFSKRKTKSTQNRNTPNVSSVPRKQQKIFDDPESDTNSEKRVRARSSSQGSILSDLAELENLAPQERSSRSQSVSYHSSFSTRCNKEEERDVMDLSALNLEKLVLIMRNKTPRAETAKSAFSIRMPQSNDAAVVSGASLVFALIESSFATTQLQAVLLAVLLLRGHYITRISRQPVLKSMLQRESRFNASPRAMYRFLSASQQPVQRKWVLLLHVNGARNLDASESRPRGGGPNPLVKAVIGPQVSLSKTRMGTHNPKWTMDILFVISQSDVLHLSVFDAHFPSTRTLLLGKTAIDLSQLFAASGRDAESRFDLCRWYPLQSRGGGRTDGEVLLSLSVLNREALEAKTGGRRPRVHSVEERVSKHVDVRQVLANTNRGLTRTNIVSRMYHGMKRVKAAATIFQSQAPLSRTDRSLDLLSESHNVLRVRRYLSFCSTADKVIRPLMHAELVKQVVVEQVQTISRIQDDPMEFVIQIDFVSNDTRSLQTVHIMVTSHETGCKLQASTTHLGELDPQFFLNVISRASVRVEEIRKHSSFEQEKERVPSVCKDLAWLLETQGDALPARGSSKLFDSIVQPLEFPLLNKHFQHYTSEELILGLFSRNDTVETCSFETQLREDGYEILSSEPWHKLDTPKVNQNMQSFQSELVKLRERMETQTNAIAPSSNSTIHFLLASILLFLVLGTSSEWIPMVFGELWT